MPHLRLRETFNRLQPSSIAVYFRRTMAALLVSASVALPAAAHHNDNNDLNPVDSRTKASQDLQSLQDTFNRAVKGRRIVLVDRDWIELNRALSADPANEDLRNRLIVEQLLRYGRLHPPQDYFKDKDDGDLNNEHSEILTVHGPNGAAMRVCMVYGGREEQDMQSRLYKFLDLSTAVHGSQFAGARIKTDLDPETFRRFVTRHEVGHCMDDWFMPAMQKTDPAVDAAGYLLNYNRAETFADVYGALAMARDEGVSDIAGKIANIRLANAALAGPYDMKWYGPGRLTAFGSFVYSTHRSLRAAQDYIDAQGAASLKGMSYDQLAALAHDIVDRNMLNERELQAEVFMFMSRFDMNVWEMRKSTSPAIAAMLPYAYKLRQEMADALRAVLDLPNIPQNADILAMLPFTGDPLDVAAEQKAREMTPAQQQRRIDVLTDQLVQQAGGTTATLRKLVDAFTLDKDKWRIALEHGTAQEKREAMENLSVGGKALAKAAERVRDAALQSNMDNVLPLPLKM